jgi:hypothetical protein
LRAGVEEPLPALSFSQVHCGEEQEIYWTTRPPDPRNADRKINAGASLRMTNYMPPAEAGSWIERGRLNAGLKASSTRTKQRRGYFSSLLICCHPERRRAGFRAPESKDLYPRYRSPKFIAARNSKSIRLRVRKSEAGASLGTTNYMPPAGTRLGSLNKKLERWPEGQLYHRRVAPFSYVVDPAKHYD